MPGPFDTIAKDLVHTYPLDWLRFVGQTAPGAADVIEADLSTVAAEANKVLRVQAPPALPLGLTPDQARPTTTE